MKDDLISRRALMERINYYITHTAVDSPENYAYSLIFEEVSKAPAVFDKKKVINGIIEIVEKGGIE